MLIAAELEAIKNSLITSYLSNIQRIKVYTSSRQIISILNDYAYEKDGTTPTHTQAQYKGDKELYQSLKEIKSKSCLFGQCEFEHISTSNNSLHEEDLQKILNDMITFYLSKTIA